MIERLWAVVSLKTGKVFKTYDALGTTAELYVSREDALLVSRTAYKGRSTVVRVVLSPAEDQGR